MVKIPAEKKTVIEAAVEKLKEAHKAQDIAAIDTAMTELNAAWTAASQDIYNAQQNAEQPAADGQATSDNGGQKAADDNVQDVPFEEVKSDKE